MKTILTFLCLSLCSCGHGYKRSLAVEYGGAKVTYDWYKLSGKEVVPSK